MHLTTAQRFGFYGIGLGLGLVVATIIFQVHGAPHAPEPPPPGTIRREVPGAVSQWMLNRQHIEGDFLLSQSDDLHAASHPDGVTTRAVVLPGLDQGAFIRVEEKSSVSNPAVVTEWKFMFANSVRAQLVTNADTRALADAFAKLGWHFTGARDKDGWVTIALASPDVRAVPQAVDQLKAWPQWVAQAEPDFLPPPSDKGPGL